MSHLAFHRDAFMRTLSTEVTGAGATDEGEPFVVLADTILYPEGGGQPCDHGTISGSVSSQVVAVHKHGAEIRHVLGQSLSLERLAEAFPVGEQVLVELDWSRRLDHMQQHTAQHLLTAVADSRLGWSTTAFHLGPELSDVELTASEIPADRLRDLEDLVAAEIVAGRPVRALHVGPDDLDRMEVRSRGLPEDHSGDVRLIEIEGVDLNTCGGTHLRSTAEIAGLSLVGTEPMRGGTRVFFVAGDRQRRRMAAHEARNARLRVLLGAPDSELVDLVSLRLDREKELGRLARRLGQDLAEAEATALAAAPEPVVGGHWPHLDMPFLQALARGLIERAPAKLALLSAGSEKDGCFVLAKGADADVDLGALGRQCCEMLDGRGGGKPPIFQGRATRVERRDEAMAVLRAAWPAA